MTRGLARLGGGPVVGLVYLAAALFLTWPLCLNLASRLPLGSEPTPTVAYFNLWTLGWNASWLAAPDAGYWDAPIFHPTPGAFAFSDPQPLTGLVAAPLWWVNRALAYNGTLLLFLTLNGVAVRSLLRQRGLAAAAALAGGLWAQFLPFLTHERGVLQLQPLFGLAWALDALWRLAEEASWRRGWALAAAIVVTFLTSEYYGLFLLVLLTPTVLLDLPRFRRRSALLGVALGLGVAAAVVVPLLRSQALHLERMGFERSQGTVAKYSASAGDYLRPSPQTVMGRLVDPGRGSGGKFLSPGWMLLLLSVIGLRRGLGRGPGRRWCLALLTSAALALLLSLGPNLMVGRWRPYELVQAVAPGFASLRSPFRLAVLVQLCTAGLAALGVGSLLHRRRHGAALVLTVLSLVELFPVPSRLTPIPATLEPGSVPSPAVFLPYAAGSNAGDYLKTVAVMNAVLPARVRLVNGYSGFFPPLNAQLKKILAEFPTPQGLRALRALGVQTLLVQLSALGPEQRQRLSTLLQAGELRDRGGRRELRALYLAGSALRPATDYRGRWSLQWRWRRDGVELRVTPLDLDSEMWVAAPGVAPLSWRVRWREIGGAAGEAVLSAPGSFLLYQGSEYPPRLRLSLPDDRGRYRIELLDLASGEIVAVTRIGPRR